MSRARDLADAGSKANFLDNVTANIPADIASTYAPLASPDFTGTVDLTGTTLNLDNDQINGSVISGGIWGGGGTFEGTLTGTIASSVSCEYHQYTSLLNSWSAWNLTSGTGAESGVKVMRMGPLYIVHISANNQTTSVGTFTSKILTLDSNITNPTNTVRCGGSFYGTGSQNDYVAHLEIESDGDVQLYIYNPAGAGVHIASIFVGLDT